MRNPSPRIALLVLCLLIGAVLTPLAARPAGAHPEATAEAAPAAAETPDTAAQDTGGHPPLVQHAAQAQALLVTLQSIVGPLPAIASTPFFALAGLTGLALFSKADFESTSTLNSLLARNSLVREAGRYASPELVVALLALAIIGWLANSGKIQGSVGKFIRMAEDSSAVLAYLYLSLSTLAANAPPSGPAAVASAGVLDASFQALLALAIATGLTALMITRFAFDLLIWLSPVPFLDLVFETSKWVFTAAFAALALFFPTAAAVVSMVMVLAALVVSRWAWRLMRFAITIVISPLWSRGTGSAHATHDQSASFAAIALRVPGLPARIPGRLERGSESACFRWKNWAGTSRTRPLGAAHATLELGRSLLWIELRLVAANGQVLERYALSRVLLPDFEQVRSRLGARDGGNYGLARLGREHAPAPAPASPGR